MICVLKYLRGRVQMSATYLKMHKRQNAKRDGEVDRYVTKQT